MPLSACYNATKFKLYLFCFRSLTVAKNKHPLRINIGFLLNQPVGTSRDFDFEFNQLILPPDIELTDFSGTAHISRTRQGLLVEGVFTGTVEAECVRCLRSTEQHLKTQFQELYAFTRDNVSESDLVLPEDGHIDLGPIVGEYLVIEIPIKPLCRENCRGLCMVCGANLNEQTCEHVAQIQEE